MRKSVNSKKGLVVVSCIASISALLGSFSGNLNSYQVYSQAEQSLLGTREKLFLISEFDKKVPFGFQKDKAVLKFESLDNQAVLKIGLLGVAILIPGLVLTLGGDLLENIDIETEVADISVQAKKDLKLAQVKQKFALASKAQQQLFLQELKELVDLSDDLETERITDSLDSKFVQCANLIMDGYDADTAVAITWEIDRGTEEHAKFLERFQEWQTA